jgi:hypothetical protein
LFGHPQIKNETCFGLIHTRVGPVLEDRSFAAVRVGKSIIKDDVCKVPDRNFFSGAAGLALRTAAAGLCGANSVAPL